MIKAMIITIMEVLVTTTIMIRVTMMTDRRNSNSDDL